MSSCSEPGNPERKEVGVSMASGTEDTSGGASTRRCRVNSHTHSHSHGRSWVHRSNSEPVVDSTDSNQEFAEPSTGSVSELRYLYRWLQKSLPFLILLCSKLVIQHAAGLSVGVGILTSFLYVNKNIQTQVFLQERHSKLQCVWLLLFLTTSTLLLYYTFFSETLYYCLIFLRPNIEPLDFWAVLWAVVITSFVIKFLCMGTKCLILLLPSPVMSYRTQGCFMILIEELGQLYQFIAPVSLWCSYLISYQEADGFFGVTLSILLALFYLILKLLGLYNQWTSLLETVRVFLKGEHPGSAVTWSLCNDVGDICAICQGKYKEPQALLCQHIFCDKCIVLWFTKEKSCPVCHTVITEKIHDWRDGSTSSYLHIY